MSSIVRVWDLPTRVFHWGLVFAVVGLVTTAQIAGNAMVWHFRFGYAVLSLLLFRLIWGVVGGHWSRFSSFLYAPSTLVQYLKGRGAPEHGIGHNPLGAFSVFALLGFLLLQVGSGLVSDDEIAATGPFARFVSRAVVSKGTFYHTSVGKVILIVLVITHVSAIIFYRYRKGENLVRPMILGDKQTMIEVQGSRDDTGSRTLAAILFAGCILLVAWLVRLAGG